MTAPSLYGRLWGNVDYLRKGFTDMGFDIGHSETPIIPVMLGDEDKVPWLHHLPSMHTFLIWAPPNMGRCATTWSR